MHMGIMATRKQMSRDYGMFLMNLFYERFVYL